MDNREPIQTYDVAVLGGGTAATICAYTLARQGLRVTVLAERSSLMHELGLARLHTPHLREIADRYEAVRDWYALLSQYEQYNGRSFDPVLVQLTADRFLEEQRVDVLFETSAVAFGGNDKNDASAAGVACAAAFGEQGEDEVLEITLAWRGGTHRVRCRYVVDCSQHAALLARKYPQTPNADRFVYRTLTMVNNEPARVDEQFAFELDERTYSVKIEPGRFGGVNIRIATPCDTDDSALALEFMARLEQLLGRIRQLASIRLGDLVHAGEYGWSPPPFLLPQSFEYGVVAAGRNYAGTGCWIESIGRQVQAGALWDKPGVAISEQMKAGAETALQVLRNVAVSG